MKTSVEHSIEDRWDVTGDDGMSRFSLVLLRIMMAAFFISTIGFLTIVSGLVDTSSLSVRIQASQIVLGVCFCFTAVGLGAAISMHPILGSNSRRGLGIGLFLFFALSSFHYDIAEKFDLNPFLIFPGIQLIIGLLVFLPIAYAAWTTQPRA